MDSNELSNSYNNYLIDNNYEKALELLLQSYKFEPNSSWIVTCISSCFYEIRDYVKALEWSEKAYTMNPRDPLVRWDYAGALYGMNQYIEAIKIWKKIIRRGINNIAFVDCGEGIRWAKRIYNDCFYRIGIAYSDLGNYKKALEYYQKHLNLRKRGIPSIYKKAWVLKDLKQAEQFLLKDKKKSIELKFLKKNIKDIWTGLINIAPMIGCQDLEKNERAYTTIILYAENELDFNLKVTEFLQTEQFAVLEFEDIETIASLMNKINLSDKMISLLKLVIKDKIPQISTLHVYKEGI